MAEIYRESRTYRRERGRDDSPVSSDDESKYTTTKVRRYKVTPGRSDRVERIERDMEIDDDRRSRYSGHPGRSSGTDLLDVTDRRFERTSYDRLPERAHSAIGARESTTIERKVVDRDRDDRDYYYRDRDRDDRPRSTYVEQERRVVDVEPAFPTETRRTVVERQVIERDRDRDRDRDDDFRMDDRDRSRTLVYEKTKEVGRERDTYSPRDWDRQSRMPWDHDDRDTELRIEKRVERREADPYPPEVERYRRETEYYEPAPAPIVIRQRMPEQRIIVQEAPAPPPVVIREQREVARREPTEEEYYYRRESRESRDGGPYRGERREEDYAVMAGRRGRDDRRGRYSDGEASDDEYYVKRTTIRRERGDSVSPDHHHKRHLAEGALAGAGISALLASRRDDHGDLPEHRGRKVIAGAALGALGTEVVRRAKSAYDDRYGEPSRGRSRSRSRSRHGEDDDRHSKLKTGLGIAAAALAVAGAAKLYQSNKVEKEEASRGRSRRRGDYSDYSDYSRSPSRKRSRSRSVAKAALGTAAVAGLVKHFHDKSKARNGSGSPARSHSRLRTGAEIVAAGLVGAAGKKLYDRHKDKKEHDRELEEEDEYYREQEERDRRHGARSRSRSVHSSRSAHTRPPHHHPEGLPADPDLGMVEYGAHPLYSDPAPAEYDGRRGARDGGHERSRSRGRRHRDGYESDESDESDRGMEKKRSRSRLRNLATGAAAAGAAAFGIKKFQDNKKEKEGEKEARERSRERSRHRGDRDRDRDSDSDRDSDRDRDRDRDRDKGGRRRRRRPDHEERERERDEELIRARRERDRRRFEDIAPDDYEAPHDVRRSPSPPTASGGAYYPPYPPSTKSADPPYGLTQHPNVATTNLARPEHTTYPADDYADHPPPGAPPNSAATHDGFPPPRTGPEHVSAASASASRPDHRQEQETHVSEEDGVIPNSNLPLVPGSHNSSNKKVNFIPLSPKSSRTLAIHHQEVGAHKAAEDEISPMPSDDDGSDVPSPSSAGNELVPVRPQRPRPRRLSDPSSNRPLISRRTSGNNFSPTDSGDDSEEDVIEYLPDRFDSQGRPLDSSLRRPRLHSRRGEFAGQRGGWNVAGQWGVAGTDDVVVDRIVHKVTDVVEGKGSILGLLGGIISGSLLEGGGEERRLEGVRSGKSGRRHAARRDYDDDGHDDGYDRYDDDYYDEGRRRGRRRRRSR